MVAALFGASKSSLVGSRFLFRFDVRYIVACGSRCICWELVKDDNAYGYVFAYDV